MIKKITISAVVLAVVLFAWPNIAAAATVCTKEYRPVCGTNGKTYSNKCLAGKVKIGYNGVCKAVKKTVAKPAEVINTVASSTYEKATVTVGSEKFIVDLVKIDLSKVEIYSSTGNTSNCGNNCGAKELKSYVTDVGGFAGIHGAYFCPPDYAPCAKSLNAHSSPFYNTSKKVLINGDKVAYMVAPILIFDTNNKPYFFVDGKKFGNVADFEAKNGVKIQALVSNYPALMSDGKNIVATQNMDEKQRTTKSSRGGIGVKDGFTYIIVAQKATVVDLANIMEKLGIKDGLNLDGGGSVALYFNGSYKVGPGRKLPSAIVFKEKK